MTLPANLLCIDASTNRASVALSMHGKIYSESIEATAEHAQLLLPMIARLLRHVDTDIKALDGIVFGRGPGSFTGIRIACSVAKGLAFAHDLPLYPVSGLASIAAQVFSTNPANTPVLSMLDARMHQVYWAFYRDANDDAIEMVTDAKEVNARISTSFILAGVGLDIYVAELPSTLQEHMLHQQVVYPDASAMINIVQSGRISAVNRAAAAPVYIRNHVTQGSSGG